MSYIYTLNDPKTHEPRYVGKTNSLLSIRLYHHIKEALRKNGRMTYRLCWIRKLINNNLFPEIELLEECNNSEWINREKYWISQLRAWNFSLTNMTDGGDGNNNQKFSKESIEKRASKIRGIPRPDFVKDKISKSNTGKKLSDSTKEILRQKNLGKKYSAEVIAKKSKPVLQFDLKNNFLQEFSSIRSAGRALNISPGAIQNACCGRGKTAGKFIWKYKN